MQPQPQTDTEVDRLLALRHPTRPARKLPLPLRKLVPDPTKTAEQLLRFEHADIAAMTLSARRAEAFRLKVAIAQCEPDEVCDWAVERVAKLEAT